MTIQYKGMRWLKCDLHMHTAGANHWAGDKVEEGQEAIAAKSFADACHRQDLDVIAITDHNFLSKDFLPYIQEAFTEIEKDSSHKITIFPGFEFEAAGVGMGVHVLALFEPDSDLAKVDSILTECGVAYPGVNGSGVLLKSDKNIKDILKIVQQEHGGIIILPHAMSNDGIFDNEQISDWLQQDQFTNPDLLAVEISKPVSQMSEGFQRLFRAGDDCLSGWKRERPIATLMSSDNKKLIEVDDDGRPIANSIGYRYSWIKMSEPSIESLRQAFLDHDSRIKLPEDITTDINPVKRQQHSAILSVKIKDTKFLIDQEIHFSPNLNCLIGGRGCGKSTILEGMRLTLGKDNDAKIDSKTQEKIARAKELLTSKEETEITVHWRDQDGVEDSLVYLGKSGGDVTCVTHKLLDLTTFLKGISVQFYSQQQINQMTAKSDSKLLSMLNDFIREPLNELEKTERDICADIQRLQQQQTQINTLKKDILGLSQEVSELDKQWQKRASLQDEARRHQGAQAAKQYVQKLKKAVAADSERLVDSVTDIVDSHSPLGSVVERWPENKRFAEIDDSWLGAKEKLQQNILTAVGQYKKTVKQEFEDEKWAEIEQILAEADQIFETACQEKGLSKEDVGRLQEISQKRQAKRLEKERREKEKTQLEKETANLENLFDQLHGTWQQVYQIRKDIAKSINQAASGEKGPVIKLSVEYAADEKSFLQQWNKLYTNRRTRLGRNWEDCGRIFFDYFAEHRTHVSEQTPPPGTFVSLWEMLAGWFEDDSVPQSITSNLQDLRLTLDEIKNELAGQSFQNWQAAQMLRIPDFVDMTLYRPDGSPAGKISDNSLSDGQRNTAALAMLLAEGKGPLVFDQPEDELDSNFIYRELVPMLRRLKNERQIILATHNANLPVNGDAELIYALQTEGGRGEKYAEGGLDQTSVTGAVLEIMEGSKDAFTKRREKYHF